MNFINKDDTVDVTLELNARLQPLHRGEIFEDMFQDMFDRFGIGEITGAGTLQMPTGEVEKCDISMVIYKNRLNPFISLVKRLDIIPKGSKLIINEEETPIGTAQGMAIYLNGTELPEEVYKNNDTNQLIEQLDTALNGLANRLSHWEGPTETALYYYGKDYIKMKKAILPVLKNHPLGEKSRSVKIV